MSEEEEIRKAKRDKKQFDVIYRKYNQQITGYIYAHVKNKENAEDLTSITFEKALKGIDNFQWEGISVQHWLYKIARNTINDFFRKKYNRTPALSISQLVSSQDQSGTTFEELLPSNDKHIEVTLIQSEEEDKLYDILMLLDEKDQYLLYYKYFEEMTNKEIAKVMDMSETNVGAKLQRLREKIKKITNAYEQ